MDRDDAPSPAFTWSTRRRHLADLSSTGAAQAVAEARDSGARA
jgi:hypothetical protein